MSKSAAVKKEGGYTPRLQTVYEKEIRATMQKQFNYKNPMQVPKLDKIVINMGVGETVNDSKIRKYLFRVLADLREQPLRVPTTPPGHTPLLGARTAPHAARTSHRQQ